MGVTGTCWGTWLLYVFWITNSGFHACAASTLPTGTFVSPHSTLPLAFLLLYHHILYNHTLQSPHILIEEHFQALTCSHKYLSSISWKFIVNNAHNISNISCLFSTITPAWPLFLCHVVLHKTYQFHEAVVSNLGW